MEVLKILLPLFIVALIYLIVGFLGKKNRRSDSLNKARVLLGGVGAGFFCCLAIQQPDLRQGLSLGFLSIVVLLGAILLQRRYFH